MRALIWDFDETLAHRAGMWAGCLVEVLDANEPGHAICVDDVRPALRDGFPWHTPDVPHPELCDADAWWARVEPILDRAYVWVGYEPLRAAELARLARDRYCDATAGWTLFDDTIPTLQRLREVGFRHVVLSNHVPELDRLIAALGLEPLLHAVVNSARTGYEKPHPEAFALARAAAGDPAEVWMIGDNPVADVAGAEAAGIPAILVRTDDPRVERRAASLADVEGFVTSQIAPPRRWKR